LGTSGSVKCACFDWRPLPAFSAVSLRTTRWLIGSLPKNSKRLCSLWTDILTMTGPKQTLFMKRVLRQFSLDNVRRTSSKQVLRMDPDKWEAEVGSACLFQWAYHGLQTVLCALEDMWEEHKKEMDQALVEERRRLLASSFEKMMANFLDGCASPSLHTHSY